MKYYFKSLKSFFSLIFACFVGGMSTLSLDWALATLLIVGIISVVCLFATMSSNNFTVQQPTAIFITLSILFAVLSLIVYPMFLLPIVNQNIFIFSLMPILWYHTTMMFTHVASKSEETEVAFIMLICLIVHLIGVYFAI